MTVRATPAAWFEAAALLAAATGVLAFTAYHTFDVLRWWAVSGGGADWPNLVGATAGNPYDTAGYRWSPVAAWMLVVVVQLGLPLWQLLHAAVLVLLKPWWMVLAAVLAWPFWHDAMNGNVVTFVFVAGALALRGHRPATLAVYALGVLMPRPLMVPIVVWLLWRQPDTRAVFVVIFVAHAVLVLASGYAGDWFTRLLETSAPEMQHPWNWLPSRWIGFAWVPVGIALAVVLTRRGWVGAAGIAAGPYLLSYYPLVLLWDLPRLVDWIRGTRGYVTASTAASELWARIRVANRSASSIE